MKNAIQFFVFIISALLISACGGGVGEYDNSTPNPIASDTTPPVFVSGNPADGTTVTTACSITAQFDEPIAPGSVTPSSFVITDQDGHTYALLTEGAWSASGSSITFVPSSDLPVGNTSVTITTDITDIAGNNLAADQSWDFDTTSLCSDDLSGPTYIIGSGTPSGNVTDACEVTAQFNESIASTSVMPASFVITDSGGNDLTGSDGAWGLDTDPSIIKFTPSPDLPVDTWTVKITTAITDDAGNTLAAEETWTFTTSEECTKDTTPPTFIPGSGDPVNSVTEACSITGVFDEPIDATSVTFNTFVIRNSIGIALTSGEGSWGLEPGSPTVIKVVPNPALPPDTWMVEVTTGIKDVAQNALVTAPPVWFFTNDLKCPPPP